MLEEIVSSNIKAYEEGYNATNEDYEIKFNLTLTQHHVEVEALKKWVAYLRLERTLAPKASPSETEALLIYNQAYKFNNIAERTDPKAPWKVALYNDLLGRLIAGGLEYGELLSRMNAYTKANKGKPLSNLVEADKPDIVITDQMPAPLTPQEKEYAEWVKQNKQK